MLLFIFSFTASPTIFIQLRFKTADKIYLPNADPYFVTFAQQSIKCSNSNLSGTIIKAAKNKLLKLFD